jgi:hypothetical protein
VLKSSPLTVTVQPPAGHDVAARAEVVMDGVKATAVREEASRARIATRATVDRPRQRSMRWPRNLCVNLREAFIRRVPPGSRIASSLERTPGEGGVAPGDQPAVNAAAGTCTGRRG